jgi:general secretion pathway protein D
MLRCKRVVGVWVCLLLGVFLTGCTASSTYNSLLDSKLATKSSPSKRERLQQYISAHQGSDPDDGSQFGGVAQLGNDQLTGAPLKSRIEELDASDPADIRLNLVDVPIAAAAKSVLGDIFEVNYSVDSRVQGTVTLQTSAPVGHKQLMNLFEVALRNNLAALVGDGDAYKIVPLAEAAKAAVPIQSGEGADPAQIGHRPQIVTLQYVSAEEMREILAPIVPDGMIVSADATRNVIILSGTAREIAAIRETISVFDVDWMKGMSVALVPVNSSQPAAIVSDLEQIYETKTGPLRNIVRFVPNRRLKSVLVISSRKKYLKEATHWIRKLDVLAKSNEQALHVYHVQNRTASDLAQVLTKILENGRNSNQTGGEANTGEVAPKLEQQEVSVAAVDANGNPVSGPETPATGAGSEAARLRRQRVPHQGSPGVQPAGH